MSYGQQQHRAQDASTAPYGSSSAAAAAAAAAGPGAPHGDFDNFGAGHVPSFPEYYRQQRERERELASLAASQVVRVSSLSPPDDVD
jgi:hypothetical protein